MRRAEEIILWAVPKLGDNAYGVAIRQEVEQLAGKSYSISEIRAASFFYSCLMAFRMLCLLCSSHWSAEKR